ncbi:poly-gamma-glutamate hydrolase family protein [Roseibacillus persicicus]|uniref:poly-gamma-glutamate hydrolase family protein n=1 Tax=Roseibacillus persicicus TaxID=454148 RepID=UPI00398B1339
MSDTYSNFAELKEQEAEGVDFRIEYENRESPISIVAPHGGKIEPQTSEVARMIAGSDFNLYLFEGIKPAKNFSRLHITSARFDEPRCLEMVSSSRRVVCVHGCSGNGEEVYLGGLDNALLDLLQAALTESGVDVVLDGHPWPGKNQTNICNRGITKQGVQIELSKGFRESGNLERLAEVVAKCCRDTSIDA